MRDGIQSIEMVADRISINVLRIGLQCSGFLLNSSAVVCKPSGPIGSMVGDPRI